MQTTTSARLQPQSNTWFTLHRPSGLHNNFSVSFLSLSSNTPSGTVEPLKTFAAKLWRPDVPAVRWWRQRDPPGQPEERRSVNTKLWWSCRTSRRQSWCSRGWRPCRRSRQRGRAALPVGARRPCPRSWRGSRRSPGVGEQEVYTDRSEAQHLIGGRRRASSMKRLENSWQRTFRNI